MNCDGSGETEQMSDLSEASWVAYAIRIKISCGRVACFMINFTKNMHLDISITVKLENFILF